MLSSNLKALREAYGLSQDLVADYLGVSHTIISNYETNKREPTHEHLNKLADLYHVDIIDLFSEEPMARLTNLAFAFRADSIKSTDLNSIAIFRRIVKNYLTLKNLAVSNS